MSVPVEERPVHPKYGRALSGAPRTVDGVTFWYFRVGINRSTAMSADGRLEVRQRRHRESFTACVDGHWLPTRFRKFHTAARAAIGFGK